MSYAREAATHTLSSLYAFADATTFSLLLLLLLLEAPCGVTMSGFASGEFLSAGGTICQNCPSALSQPSSTARPLADPVLST